MRSRNESNRDLSRARPRAVGRWWRASAMGLCISLAMAPAGAQTADILMDQDGTGTACGGGPCIKDQAIGLGFSVDTIGTTGLVAKTAEELAQYCVVWINPNLSISQQQAIGASSAITTYVQNGGVLVFLAGSDSHEGVGGIAPGGFGWSTGAGFIPDHDAETIVATGHPYVTGGAYGGTPLSASNFVNWFSTDRGLITPVSLPAGTTLVLANDDGSSFVEHSLGSGTVIFTTLMYGNASTSGEHFGAPLDNLILYATSLGGCAPPPSPPSECADIFVSANKHTVGAGTHPGSTKEPLVGIEVCAYDKSEGRCARETCGGISHQHYGCIAAVNGPCAPEACCTTDANGECTLNLPAGDYLIISNDATKTVLPDPLGVSASDLACGDQMQKHLQQIVRVDGKKLPGKSKRFTGSELLIIEPEFVVWDDTEQLYPFVFDSVGDWEVSVSVDPPDGFVADYDQLDEVVDNSLEAVQFTITEVGSDLVPTKTEFTIRHNGRVITVPSSVGILLTPDYALSRGFDVDALRARGLIVEPSELGMSTEKKDETALSAPSAIVPTPGK